MHNMSKAVGFKKLTIKTVLCLNKIKRGELEEETGRKRNNTRRERCPCEPKTTPPYASISFSMSILSPSPKSPFVVCLKGSFPSGKQHHRCTCMSLHSNRLNTLYAPHYNSQFPLVSSLNVWQICRPHLTLISISGSATRLKKSQHNAFMHKIGHLKFKQQLTYKRKSNIHVEIIIQRKVNITLKSWLYYDLALQCFCTWAHYALSPRVCVCFNPRWDQHNCCPLISFPYSITQRHIIDPLTSVLQQRYRTFNALRHRTTVALKVNAD